MTVPSAFTALTLFLLFSKTQTLEYTENIVTDDVTAAKWIRASTEFDELIFSHKKFMIDFLDDVVEKIPSLSRKCSAALSTISSGLSNKQLWAYQYLDASALRPSGLANGYIGDLGDFEQCLSINEGSRGFHGAYCLVNFKFPLTKQPERSFLRGMKLNLRHTELKDSIYEFYGNHTELFFYESFMFALCLPSVCSDPEVSQLLNHAFKNKEIRIELHGSCTRYTGFVANYLSKPLDAQLSLILIVALAALVIVSTLAVYFDAPGRKYAEIFCAVRNTRKLVADYKDPAMKKLMFFDSFKCFFQIGGIFGHICTFMAVVPVMFPVIRSIDKSVEDSWILFEMLQKAIHLTQVIILISGFFTAYYMIPAFEKSGRRITFFAYAIKRWIRTAPCTIIAICMLFCVSAISYGPLAEDLENSYLNNCRKSWIYTVLQINNFNPTQEICLSQTWTQAADFHLWLLAFYPLKLLATNPKRGVKLCGIIIAIGVVVPMIVTYFQELPAPIGSTRIFEMIFLIIRGDTFPYMVFHTYNVVASYFIGILLGYVCYKEIKISPIYVAAAAFSIVSFFVACLYGPYLWINYLGMEFNDVANAIYFGVLRVCFALVWGSNIYVTYFYMDAFPLTEIVKSKLLIAFGRLSMSIYTSQLAPVAYYMVMSYDPIPVNRQLLIIRILLIITQCCLVGYFTFLIVEAPFINMTKSAGFKSNSAQILDDGTQSVSEKPENGIKSKAA